MSHAKFYHDMMYLYFLWKFLAIFIGKLVSVLLHILTSEIEALGDTLCTGNISLEALGYLTWNVWLPQGLSARLVARLAPLAGHQQVPLCQHMSSPSWFTPSLPDASTKSNLNQLISRTLSSRINDFSVIVATCNLLISAPLKALPILAKPLALPGRDNFQVSITWHRWGLGGWPINCDQNDPSLICGRVCFFSPNLNY